MEKNCFAIVIRAICARELRSITFTSDLDNYKTLFCLVLCTNVATDHVIVDVPAHVHEEQNR